MPQQYITARETAERLDLTHLQVIDRIRKGQIKAKKWGWNWAVPIEEVERVKEEPWYKKLLASRASN